MGEEKAESVTVTLQVWREMERFLYGGRRMQEVAEGVLVGLTHTTVRRCAPPCCVRSALHRDGVFC